MKKIRNTDEKDVISDEKDLILDEKDPYYG
jgi:hypothetical protein